MNKEQVETILKNRMKRHAKDLQEEEPVPGDNAFNPISFLIDQLKLARQLGSSQPEQEPTH